MIKSEAWKYTNINRWLERDYAAPLAQSIHVTAPAGVEVKTEENNWVIRVPKNTVVAEPIYIADIAAQLDASTLLAATFEIVLEAHSQATIVHTFQAEHANNYWRQYKTEITLAANAQLHYYQTQAESETSLHTHEITVHQARDSRFTSFTLDNGGGIVRTDLCAKLQEENASCEFKGLYLVKNKQHVDNHTTIEHLSPNTHSDELYKGIATDHGRAVFNGRVYVAPHAQKITSKQHNANLLLTKTAEIDTKPELEIYADDVQCAHGATVGNLDLTALFYLQARGVPEALAKQLLTYGFVQSLLTDIPNETVKTLFTEQLVGWFNHEV